MEDALVALLNVMEIKFTAELCAESEVFEMNSGNTEGGA